MEWGGGGGEAAVRMRRPTLESHLVLIRETIVHRHVLIWFAFNQKHFNGAPKNWDFISFQPPSTLGQTPHPSLQKSAESLN